MKITRSSLLTGMMFLAITMSGSVWGQVRYNINSDAEFGWRVEDNKRTTTSAGTAVLKDNQLQNIVPGSAMPVDARSFDVSQPSAGGIGTSLGTNFLGTSGIGGVVGRNSNVAPSINLPALPTLPFAR